MSSGVYRNFGFIRFVFFFLMLNYLFFIYGKNSNILKIWSIIFFLVLIDIYVERFSGSNIFGFGKLEIDGIPQPHGTRVISFFRNEPIAGSTTYKLIEPISPFSSSTSACFSSSTSELVTSSSVCELSS